MQQEAELKLREQIREAIDTFKGDFNTVKEVRNSIRHAMTDKQNQSAIEGFDASRKCRDRIRERRKIEKANIELFKTQLAASNMPSTQVNVISDLISQKNTDITNGYFIKSKLSDKQNTRINDICRDLLNQ